MANHPRDYEYEVVVLGGGPAGIAAACAAAESGCRVALLESTPWLGGPIWRTRPGEPAAASCATLVARGSSDRASKCSTARQPSACTRPDVLHTERDDEVLNIGWHALVLAIGSQELFLPFPGWTLPNVIGAGGLQLLGKSGWPVAGKRVVVAGTGPLSIAVAAYLVRHGARVTDILEQAPLAIADRDSPCRLPALGPGQGVAGAWTSSGACCARASAPAAGRWRRTAPTASRV